MGCQMKTLARIICISLAFLVPVARIGADDKKQAPSLFDQVREAIPKLKPGIRIKEAMRILHSEKLGDPHVVSLTTQDSYIFVFPGKPKQRLVIQCKFGLGSDFELISATLQDDDKIVSQFDAQKK